jgi:hypothetical protein
MCIIPTHNPEPIIYKSYISLYLDPKPWQHDEVLVRRVMRWDCMSLFVFFIHCISRDRNVTIPGTQIDETQLILIKT